MRHRLVHGYDEVDWKQVLDVLHNDLIPLAKAIEQYFNDYPGTPAGTGDQSK
jgi:uncharacterized protein with HEPN domain